MDNLVDYSDFDWQLVCDYNPISREVKYCYYNPEDESKSDTLPEDLDKFVQDTQPKDWVGHLSTKYVPFKQFYTHKGSNISVWHEPPCLIEIRDSYDDSFDDWAIRSKKLEMDLEVQLQLLDFDNVSSQNNCTTAIEISQFNLLQLNKQRYIKSNKVTPSFVCFYKNNVTQQCCFELPPSLDALQQKSDNHRDWTPQLSTNINKFYYLHNNTNICLWDIPLVYKMNRDKHLHNATKDDWRVFISSDHKKPLYLHTKSKITQFELPEPLSQAEKLIIMPADWISGINPLTKLPYYYNKTQNITLWHLPTCLQNIKLQFYHKRDQHKLAYDEEVKKARLERKKQQQESGSASTPLSSTAAPYVDYDYSYWEVQYTTFSPKSISPTMDQTPTPSPSAASRPTSANQQYISYYRHRFTQECTTELPLSILQWIKTTKSSDWVKVNIAETSLFYYEHQHPVPKDFLGVLDDEGNKSQSKTAVIPTPSPLAVTKQAVGDEISVATPDVADETLDTGVSVWQSPLDIIAENQRVLKQTESQYVFQVNGTNNSLADEATLDPLDDVDNWMIYYDPNATITSIAPTLTQSIKQQRRSTTSQSASRSPLADSSSLYDANGDDDDDDDNFGGLSGSGSHVGGLLSSATFQLQGLDLSLSSLNFGGNGSQPPSTKNSTLNNLGIRTELEEGQEIGGTVATQRRSSFSTLSFSTTQRHLQTSQKGQQLYFNSVTKTLQPELPTCFELYQSALSSNSLDDWESALGKLAPFPFYRHKLKRSIIIWHEPYVVMNYRLNEYAQLEATSLEMTVKDWSIRFVPESNTAYYRNNKTLWYQTTIPEALDQYQQHSTKITEWDSILSSTSKTTVYCHVKPNGDTGCSLIHPPDCMKTLIKQIDPSTNPKLAESTATAAPATGKKKTYTQVSGLDQRFNTNVTFQDNVLNWELQYDSVSNTTYYKNKETLYISCNIPKTLYLLGLAKNSTHNDWKQSTAYFNADGEQISLHDKEQMDKEIDEKTIAGLKVSKNRYYIEKSCYEYTYPLSNNTIPIRVFHRPHVLRDFLRKTEAIYDWSLTRSSDNTQFVYKNKSTGELSAELPSSLLTWLQLDKDALREDHWVGCVDTTLKQSYYKHKPTNIMVSWAHEPPVLAEIRNKSYTCEEELAQWTIFANKVDNRCYYQNRSTKQCVIGRIPKVLFDWSSGTRRNEWNYIANNGVINVSYWHHIKSGVRMWEEPNFLPEQ